MVHETGPKNGRNHQPVRSAGDEGDASASSSAPNEHASPEDAKDSIADTSGEQEAESEYLETPAQVAAETFADAAQTSGTNADDSAEESDKTRAAAASSGTRPPESGA